MKSMTMTVFALCFSVSGGIGAIRLATIPAGGDCRLQWSSTLGLVAPECAGDCVGYPEGMTTCCMLTEVSGNEQTHRCVCKSGACHLTGEWVDINKACSGKITIDWSTGQVVGNAVCIMDNPSSCKGGQTPPKKCKPRKAPTGNTPFTDVCSCENI